VRDVSDFTGWPEMLGGRVKTLHPKVHGGLLYRRKHKEDHAQAAEHGISPIDLVVVNLYPFEATASKSGLTAEELIENIDIGGPTMFALGGKKFRERDGDHRSHRLFARSAGAGSGGRDFAGDAR